MRLKTLLSVDDMVKGIREYLMSVGEWDRTFFIMTRYCVVLYRTVSY
jgi:hypothetical protein